MALFRSLPSVALPAGLQFAVTWSIPDDFGGMTSALLHRSRAFVTLGGKPVDILTFDARTDYDAVERRLRDRGELIDGMRLHNLYDWLRENPVPQVAPGALYPDRDVLTPLTPVAGSLVATRTAPDGTTLQVDYYRRDGSLLLSDRRDTVELGTPGGRSIVLCDESGVPIRSWSKVWGLYRFWLDLLRQRRPSFMIVDSKTAANFMATYRRKRAVIMHVVHNSHLTGNDVRESRRQVFENLDAFDSVDVLTPRQRRDIEARFGPRSNLAVVPNGRDTAGRPRLDRDPHRGMVLASLTPRKRVDHALAAVDALPVTLEVYGDGEERAALEAIAGPTVVFHGHRVDARARLADASFLLLTASSEGFPLVLVEAMAAGCIPIAYDVPYGPADIIVDGRNGFLVAPGDVDGLRSAIRRLLALSPRELARMRRAAHRSAAVYSDAAVTHTWAKEMRAAADRKARAWAEAATPKAS